MFETNFSAPIQNLGCNAPRLLRAWVSVQKMLKSAQDWYTGLIYRVRTDCNVRAKRIPSES